MAEEELPVEDHVASTDLTPDAEPELTNPDARMPGASEFLSGLFNEPAEQSPEVEEEPDIQELEVSEDEAEQTPSDDDSNIEEGEETEVVAEESVENTPNSVVDFEEMKEHQFEIGGKVYSANDLKAALGRQTKQEEARKEVETAQAKLEAREARVNELESAANENLNFIQKRTELAGRDQQLQALKAQQAEAAKNNDTNKWQQLEMHIRPLQDYIAAEGQKLQGEMQEHAVKNTEVQAKILAERGYGDILKDSQRMEALSSYVSSIHPSVAQMVDNNAYLFELAEKARLYDAAQETGKQRKLKGNAKKTLKGGAGGPKPKPKTTGDPFKDQIRAMFNS